MDTSIAKLYGKLRGLLPKNKLKTDYDSLTQRLKELEMQVETSAQQLEVAKSNFLKNIYHEIRTPLNSIVGFSNLLTRDRLLSEKEREDYNSMLNMGTRVFLNKMDDIIQASLLEAGMIKMNYESFKLDDFFEENNAFFSVRKHTAEKSSVALLLSVDDSVKGMQFHGDKFRITQVLTHLVDNALKFTEKGIVEYGCKLDGTKIKFFVTDSSTNKLDGKESILFTKFSTISDTNNEQSGLGLGLAICKSLVDLMEGDIGYESTAHNGNQFYFSLPIVSGNDSVYSNEKNKVEVKRETFDPILKRHSLLAV